MNLQTITTFLNNGLPDATGGVMSAIAIELFKRAKSFFEADNVISKEQVEELFKENEDFSNTILKLEKELNKSRKTNNFYGDVGKQIIIDKMEGDITM